MPERCPYHDDLVVNYGAMQEKLHAIHCDVLEIKKDLYESGNGGAIGWMYKLRGQIAIVSLLMGALGGIITTVVALVTSGILG